MARFNHRTLPKRHNYSTLFGEEERAKMAYNRDTAFRKFVAEWNIDAPELIGWSLVQFYNAYKCGAVQLSITF